MTSDDLTAAARYTLLGLRGRDGGWGYRRGAASCAEPSALAGLALLASESRDTSSVRVAAALHGAADWLTTVQQTDGSIGVSASTASPGWSTPYAMLFWRALGVHEEPVRVAASWLLGQKGRVVSKADDPQKIAGHDTTLVGWPWVDDTHSWLEPTAMAVLALGRVGRGDHPRVQEGLRLIRDRATEPGGWNYGNKAVFGHPLRAQPAPTGLALLALAGTGPQSRIVNRALDYLRETLPGVRASASLGWGLVGLRAWGETPSQTDRWLHETLERIRGRADAAPKLACLLLAGGENTLGLFGRARR